MTTHSKFRILLVEDELSFHSLVITLLTGEGYLVHAVTDGVQAINDVQRSFYDLILLDLNMPRVGGIEVLQFVKQNYPTTEVVMLTGVHDIKTAVECMKKGAFYYLTKPFNADELLSTVGRALERRTLLLQNAIMQSKIERLSSASEIIGRSPAIQKVLDLARRVASTDTTVLVQGASGTGKELFANFIYRNSARCDQPFVAINCASIPDSLIESELFGHEKGAFTDARSQKNGLVEIANTGTLFLDEVGDISPIIQPKLLRYIQTGEFRRVGGNIVLKSDVRIISATNKDLRWEVEEGRFREDLFYRLNVITLEIPPLCERKEDIPLLLENFLCNRARMKGQKTLSPGALAMLAAYDWPGNIREFENVIERAAILSEGSIIDVEDLALPVHGRKIGVPQDEPSEDPLAGATLSEIERRHIVNILKMTGWNKSAAAKILDISLKTLYTKISTYRLEPPD